MCLIAIGNPGTDKYSEFFMAALKAGFESNSHGAGFAYTRVDDVIFKTVHLNKGFMTWSSFERAYLGANLNPADTVMVHFRIGTSGLRNGANTHPFNLTETTCSIDLQGPVGLTNAVLMHNGVLSQFVAETSVHSDTYNFCRDFMGKKNIVDLLKKLSEEEFMAMFQKYISHNKLSILFPDGTLKLINSSGFHDCQGYSFSNYSYNRGNRIPAYVPPEVDTYSAYEEGKYWENYPKTPKKEISGTDVIENLSKKLKITCHNYELVSLVALKDDVRKDVVKNKVYNIRTFNTANDSITFAAASEPNSVHSIYMCLENAPELFKVVPKLIHKEFFTDYHEIITKMPIENLTKNQIKKICKKINQTNGLNSKSSICFQTGKYTFQHKSLGAFRLYYKEVVDYYRTEEINA